MNTGLGITELESPGTSSRYALCKRRSNIEIMADILRTGEHGAGKTEIMYSANMSYSQTQRYLNYLVEQGFINRIDMDGTMTAYQVTGTGKELLRAIDTLLNLLS